MKTLDGVVKEIFEIIPSYYDEREARSIRQRIIAYMNDVARRDEVRISKPTMADVPMIFKDGCPSCDGVRNGLFQMDEVYVHPH